MQCRCVLYAVWVVLMWLGRNAWLSRILVQLDLTEASQMVVDFAKAALCRKRRILQLIVTRMLVPNYLLSRQQLRVGKGLDGSTLNILAPIYMGAYITGCYNTILRVSVQVRAPLMGANKHDMFL